MDSDTFTENTVNHNLEQMVEIPTRNNNILNLFFTSIPSPFHEIKPLPELGTSDQYIIFQSKVKRGGIKQNPRKFE